MVKCKRFHGFCCKKYIILGLDLIFPLYCQGCGRIGVALCDCCKKVIRTENFEKRQFFSDDLAGRFSDDFEKVMAVGQREGVWGEMIKNLKYKSMRDLAPVIAKMAAEKVGFEIASGAVIVPLPTIKLHIEERGFDHMRLIALQLAECLGVTVGDNLIRVNNTVQVGASREMREKQARSAYMARNIDPTVDYILLDDVVTTGASMRAAAAAMKKAGARHLSALALSISD